MIEKIHWLGHASFRIDAQAGVIYIDPWKISNQVKGDFIFVTHEHYDHFSPEDIEKLLKPSGTTVICPTSVESGAKKIKGNKNVVTINPNEEKEIGKIKVKGIWAYNKKSERLGFHPRDSKKPRVGFLITVDGGTIYHTGDSDEVPEMEGLEPDVLLIPVGGTYTMDAKEAASAASKIRPKVVVPMHWGDIVGAKKDAEEFSKLYKGNVRILEKE